MIFFPGFQKCMHEWEGSKDIEKATCMPFLSSDICRHGSAQKSQLKSYVMWVLACAHERGALTPFSDRQQYKCAQ